MSFLSKPKYHHYRKIILIFEDLRSIFIFLIKLFINFFLRILFYSTKINFMSPSRFVKPLHCSIISLLNLKIPSKALHFSMIILQKLESLQWINFLNFLNCNFILLILFQEANFFLIKCLIEYLYFSYHFLVAWPKFQFNQNKFLDF